MRDHAVEDVRDLIGAAQRERVPEGT